MKDFQILCLMTVGRAGSKLFHSLLDNHPQVICFPRTLQFSAFWQQVSHRRDDLEYLIDKFIELDPRFYDGRAWAVVNKFDKADMLGPGRDETFSVNIDEFRRIFFAENQGRSFTRHDLFIALHSAYHLARGKVLPDKGLILYHIHGVYFEDELAACMEDYPGRVHVVMTTRDPVKSLDSCVKWMEMQNVMSFGGLLFFTREVFKDAQGLSENFPTLDFRVSPLERLHQGHEKAMRSLVDWLQLDWHDSLMSSTIHGKLWLGNTKEAKEGTNPAFPNFRPSGPLQLKDWRMFCTLFPNRMQRYGYLDADEQQRHTYGGLKLRLVALLPMSGEWAILHRTVNPWYWKRTYDDLKSDIFTRYRNLPDKRRERNALLLNNQDSDLSQSTLRLHMRVYKQFFIRLIWANPLVGVYMYVRRVHSTFGWIRRTAHARQPVADVLCRESTPQTGKDEASGNLAANA